MKENGLVIRIILFVALVSAFIGTYFIMESYTESRYEKFYNEAQYTDGTVIDVMKDNKSYDVAYEYYVDGDRFVANDYMGRYLEDGMHVSVYYNKNKPECSVLLNSQRSLSKINKVMNGTWLQQK